MQRVKDVIELMEILMDETQNKSNNVSILTSSDIDSVNRRNSAAQKEFA